MPWLPTFRPDTFESQFKGAPALRVEELTPSDYVLIGPGEKYANLGAALKADTQVFAFKPGAHIAEARRDIMNERIFLVGFDPDHPARLDWNTHTFAQARPDPTHAWRFRSMGGAAREVVVANLILENLPQFEAIGAKVVFYNCHIRKVFYDLFFQQGSKESGVRNPGFTATVNCLIEDLHNRYDPSSSSRPDGLYQAGNHTKYDEAENERSTHFLFLNNFVRKVSGMALGHYKAQVWTHRDDGLYHIRLRNNLALNASRGLGFDVHNFDAVAEHNVVLKLPDFKQTGLQNLFDDLWKGPFAHLNAVEDVALRHNLYATFCDGEPFLWVHSGHSIESLDQIELTGGYWGVNDSMQWSWTPGARHGGFSEWLPLSRFKQKFQGETIIDREAFRSFTVESDPRAILDTVQTLTQGNVMTGELDPIGPSWARADTGNGDGPPPPPVETPDGIYISASAPPGLGGTSPGDALNRLDAAQPVLDAMSETDELAIYIRNTKDPVAGDLHVRRGGVLIEAWGEGLLEQSAVGIGIVYEHDDAIVATGDFVAIEVKHVDSVPGDGGDGGPIEPPGGEYVTREEFETSRTSFQAWADQVTGRLQALEERPPGGGDGFNRTAYASALSEHKAVIDKQIAILTEHEEEEDDEEDPG